MLLQYLIIKIILPPALNIVLLLLGFLLLRRNRPVGRALISVSTLLLILFSLPVCADFIQRSVEYWPPQNRSDLAKTNAEAIVVLSASKYNGAPEFDREVADKATLERLQYAVHLKRITDLPILVTGGNVLDDGESLAETMAYTLKEQFLVEAQWQERKSRTTWENALYSMAICEKEGIHKILLVTHALHMPRSVLAFEKAGFDVIPAPTHFNDARFRKYTPLAIIPSADALANSARALHEIIGYFWYSIRY